MALVHPVDYVLMQDGQQNVTVWDIFMCEDIHKTSEAVGLVIKSIHSLFSELDWWYESIHCEICQPVGFVHLLSNEWGGLL